ncbi:MULTISPECIES: hypothetical protein [Sutcliffiella]|nr:MULTISPECIES: hypothetical protein [Sutcliffiella]WBL15718.1 hypothetical protein O1A01_03450 [Sutcliffiella sp. NC1]
MKKLSLIIVLLLCLIPTNTFANTQNVEQLSGDLYQTADGK